jgi:hypothetical protein
MAFSRKFTLDGLLSAALEKVRGAKSQSVFVEEWLRQNPQIAAELEAMHDPGFTPPIVRYEQLMERLLAFYLLWDNEQQSARQSTPRCRAASLHCAKGHYPRSYRNGPGNSGADPRCHGGILAPGAPQARGLHARGESLEAILPDIKEYGHYYYQVIFLEMAKGERKQLQHQFRSLIRGCEAVYRERLKREREHQEVE